MESSGIWTKVNKTHKTAWKNFLQSLSNNKDCNNPKSLEATTWLKLDFFLIKLSGPSSPHINVQN